MRIAWFASPTSVHVRRWVKFLHGRRHEVHLLTFSPARVEGAQVHDAGARYSFSFLSRISVPLGIAANLRFIPRLRRIIREIKPDVLHGHFLTGYAFHAACLGFRPLVVGVWGSDLYVQSRRSRVLAAMARYALRRADGVTTTAEAAGQEVTSRFGVPPEKLYNFSWGIELEAFMGGDANGHGDMAREYGITEGAEVVICNRGLRPLFRQRLLVEAFAALAPARPELHLVLHSGYGTDEAYLARLHEQIKRLRLEGRVTFLLRMLETREVAWLLRRCRVYVSLPTSDQYSSSVLEAAAAGCQVIGSDIEAYGEMVRNGMRLRLVSGEDSGELAEAIAAGLDMEEAARARDAQQNIDYLKSHADWRVQAPKLEEVYASVIAQHSAGAG